VKLKIPKEALKMNLIKYKPNRMVNVFEDSWNRFFEPFFDDSPVVKRTSPSIDIDENDNRYSLEVELPGMTEKDLEVKVEGNLLTLSSKKSEEKEEKKKDYVLKERRSYNFSRSFVLPENVETDKITAEFKNGLLLIDVPKAEKAKPKLLEIKVK
jgi:HSP20 family protein